MDITADTPPIVEPQVEEPVEPEEEWISYYPMDGEDELPLNDLGLKDPEEKLGHFFEIVASNPELNTRYQILNYNANFVIKNIRHSKNPAGLLVRFFTEAMDAAKNIARKHMGANFGNAKIGLILNSINLNYPIELPMQTYQINSPNALLREFKKVNQSHQNASLLDSDVTMEIIIAKNTQGKGNKFFHNYNTHALHTFANTDQYCLFYSVFLTLKYILQDRTSHRSRVESDREFAALKEDINSGIGFQHIQQMLINAGIDPNLRSYSAEVHLPLIQHWLTFEYPNAGFKLFLFKEEWKGNTLLRPSWEGDVDNFNIGIPIFKHYRDQHFSGIKNINSLFPKGKQ